MENVLPKNKYLLTGSTEQLEANAKLYLLQEASNKKVCSEDLYYVSNIILKKERTDLSCGTCKKRIFKELTEYFTKKDKDAGVQ